MQPGSESGGIAHLGRTAGQHQEGRLVGIVGVGVPSEDAATRPFDERAVTAHQFSECGIGPRRGECVEQIGISGASHATTAGEQGGASPLFDARG